MGIVSPNGGEMRWIDEYENDVIVGYRIEMPNGQVWRYRFYGDGQLQSKARVHSPTLQETGHVFTYKYYGKRSGMNSDPWCGRVKWVIESVPTDDSDSGEVRTANRARYFRYDGIGALSLMMDPEGVRRFWEAERLKDPSLTNYELAVEEAPSAVLEPFARFSIRSLYIGGINAWDSLGSQTGGLPTSLPPFVPTQQLSHEIVIGGSGCGACGTGLYNLYYFGVLDDGLPYPMATADPLSHAVFGVMVVDPPSSPSDIRRVYRLSTYDRWGHLASRLVIVNSGQQELQFEEIGLKGSDVVPPSIQSNNPDLQIFAERYIRDRFGRLIEIHQADSYPSGGSEPSIIVGPVVPDEAVYPAAGLIALRWNPSSVGMVRKILHRPNVTSMDAIDADDAGFPVAEFVQKGPGNPFGLEEVDDPTQGLISTPRASWLSGAKFVSWRRWGFPLSYQFDNAPATAVRRAMVTEVRSMDREIEFPGGSGLAVEYAAVESAVAPGVPGVRSTSYAYLGHSGTISRPTAGLQLMARTVREQGASAVENGPDPQVTIETKTVYRLDGSVAFQVHPGGRVDYTYSRFGMPSLRIEDMASSLNQFLSSSESLLVQSDNQLAANNNVVLPSVGVNSVTRWGYLNEADGDWRLVWRRLPDGRTARFHRSVMKDGRLVDFAFSRSGIGADGFSREYGPVSWEVKTLNGRTEVSGTLGLTPEGVSLDPQYGPLVKIVPSVGVDVYDPLSVLRDELLPGGRSHVANLTVKTFDDSATRVLSQRAYPVVPSAAAQQWWASVASGSEESNFLYDSVGRMVGSRTPARTITRLLLDPLGRVRSRWVGTDDYGAAEFPQQFVQGSGTASSNLVRVEAYEYDGGGVGVGRLTASVQYSGGAETGRRTKWLFDWMGRPIVQRGPQSPHTVSKYDWAGRVVATASVVGDGANLTAETDPAATTFSDRRSLVENSYDARGQLWKTVAKSVVQVGETAGEVGGGPELVTLTWFDENGRVIKRLGSEHVKYEYDRLGRVVQEYTLARDDDGGAYAAAKGVAGDTVLRQTRTVYDNLNKSGGELGSITVDRLPGSTEVGPLLLDGAGLSGLGPMSVDKGQIKGWPQITASWYDKLNRLESSVDYGTAELFGETASANSWPRPDVAPARDQTTPEKPIRNDTEYDWVGRPWAVVDQAGRRQETTFDAMGRMVAQTSNKRTDLNNSATLTRDSNVVTRYQYSAGRMVAMWVDQEANDDNGLPQPDTIPADQFDQVTRYTYGVTPTDSFGASAVASNDLLRSVEYPDQRNASPQPLADRTQWFGYNSLGELTYSRDQNGTELKVGRDALGRETARDVVGLVDAQLDVRVRSIASSYDQLGRLASIRQYSQYSAVSGAPAGALLDTVDYSYDRWGALESVIQNGAPGLGDAAASRVQFSGGPTSAAGGERVAYRRTGHQVQVKPGSAWNTVLDVGYSFGAAGSADVGRVIGVGVNEQAAVEYRGYLGPDRLATTTLRAQRPTQDGPQTFDVATRSLVAIGGAQPGSPTGYLDRFGRVLIDRWARSDGLDPASPYFENSLSYTPEGNLAGVTDATWAEQSAVFDHDGLSRLKSARQGPIENGVARTRDESWTLSQTGNWQNRTLSLSQGADVLNEVATYSRANEWVTRTLTRAQSGPAEAVAVTPFLPPTLPSTSNPAYDLAGQLVDDRLNFLFQYDAFGRLTRVQRRAAQSGGPTPIIAEYRYNGLGHRIAWRTAATPGAELTSTDPWTLATYDDRWRLVLTRTGDAVTAAPTALLDGYAWHAAGYDGMGESSYIDSPLCRVRLASGSPERPDLARLYYLQNWRSDVVALVSGATGWAGRLVEETRYSAYGTPTRRLPDDADYNRDGIINLEDLSDFITDFYTSPPIPGGVQPDAPTYTEDPIGFGGPCPAAGDAAQPYAVDAYRVGGFRVGYSADGSNACPIDPGQNFPNMDNLSEFITAFYASPGTPSAAREHLGELSSKPIGNLFGYAGYMWDPALSTATANAPGVGGGGGTGVLVSAYYHVRHRVYDAAGGRWTRRDPLGYVESEHLTQYARGMPVVRVDSNGAQSTSVPGNPEGCNDWLKNRPRDTWSEPQRIPADTPPGLLPSITTHCGGLKYPPGMTVQECRSWEINEIWKHESVLSVRKCAKWASDQSERLYPNLNQDLCKNDMRHCVYSCCLRGRLGKEAADRILWRHECCQIHTAPDWSDHKRDILWNSIGQSLNAGNSCAEECHKKTKKFNRNCR
jgi:RHS repeat-associated protein